MRRRMFAIALLVSALAGCADDEPPTPSPIRGEYVGQEVWISYGPEEAGDPLVRVGRGEAEARQLAESLRQRVLDGADVGALARRHSNSLGGAADGFTGSLPHDANDPDDRDRALASLKIGEVTSIFAWRKGFGFAQRVSLRRGQELSDLFHRMRRAKVRLRVIVLLYEGAWIPDEEIRDRVTRSKAEAIELAEKLLRRARRGEDFAVLAGLHTNDAYGRDHGGEARIPDPENKRWTLWIPRTTRWLPGSVLEAAFATKAGEVHPEVIVSPRGVFLLKVEERE